MYDIRKSSGFSFIYIRYWSNSVEIDMRSNILMLIRLHVSCTIHAINVHKHENVYILVGDRRIFGVVVVVSFGCC